MGSEAACGSGCHPWQHGFCTIVRLDARGNLYQTVHGQGRIIVFNPLGIPIANIVVAGKDEGKFLEVTSLAIKPGTREGYITTGGEGGAAIFKFETLAPAPVLFSHQP